MLQNFLPLRLSSGFLDGGVYVMPTNFDGTQLDAELLGNNGYVDVGWYYSPTAKTIRPFAEVSYDSERTRAYRLLPGYVNHRVCTQESAIQAWNPLLMMLNQKFENRSKLEQIVVTSTMEMNDPSNVVKLPLVFDDSAAVLAEVAAACGEGYAPDPDELADYEFVAGEGMGRTFTVLELDDVRYIHAQSSTSVVWTIEHGLGLFPQVRVAEAGNPLFGRVDHIDNNTLTITFSSPRFGEAYLGS